MPSESRLQHSARGTEACRAVASAAREYGDRSLAPVCCIDSDARNRRWYWAARFPMSSNRENADNLAELRYSPRVTGATHVGTRNACARVERGGQRPFHAETPIARGDEQSAQLDAGGGGGQRNA